MEVRTRFAPSPTGYMHIGNLRTALYSYLHARKNKGKFILRIEDTDQARLVADSIRVIYDSLAVTGLEHDEGPDKGGPVGPYVQSERRAIYKEYAERLLSEGHAYRCFCEKDEKTEKQPDEEQEGPLLGYDGRCNRLSEAEVKENLAKGRPYVIRQKIDREGQTSFNDFVYGLITVDHKQLDDQILLKRDGYPTYNFANVVDDHLMGITHVMRGCEYISSTPKYILLYRAFGWSIPEHIHLPHILNEAGRKLSKREGSVALSDFLEKGYLPEAILNYIALLGWNPGTEQEYFTKAGLVEKFDIARIGRSPAIFDEKKLSWLNGQHLKAMKPEDAHKLFLKFYPEKIVTALDVRKLSGLIQSKVEKPADILGMVSFLSELDEYPMELFVNKKNKTTPESSRAVLTDLKSILSGLTSWEYAVIYAAVNSCAEAKGSKIGPIMWPLRIALSGLAVTPTGAIEIAELLGKDETLRRISVGIGKL
ncbi:MAG: glutamate--tRNA ligase [Elusimicrobia bacterium GWC2_51_8]|nr:MAG: glutamate--tRNA ligase [Elusimicrobia bacterium GWA2_51_34]OGR58842.1 MAG: glutamate--tRNA ligase [Elusimicrobia bacterium GWC2_51_8]OGR84902.1 MAG: glutamate--tRNA ligase [Elusimicrobia bacterium GWF2_52_66]HAF96061.1 glutamate--tRNA ligase [Elusimicrobiota bacterium]HCE98669.1 glutamate--tRNA ligase [Elusimicrobiota bacterium]